MNDSNNPPHIIMVGAFPPPVRGMPVVNAAVRERLTAAGAKLTIINLSAPNLGRELVARLTRLPKVLAGISQLALKRRLKGDTLYISVSGGMGQLYEIAFVVLAKLRGMRLFIHHHSFAYLNEPSLVARILMKVSGSSAVHVTQCFRMVERIKTIYGVAQIVPISNAVFLVHRHPSKVLARQRLEVLGFISNIAAEKGVYEFLDLLREVENLELPIRGVLAGPFQDSETEQRVRARLLQMRNVEYVGSKYGSEKEAFYSQIDALIFPTQYVNETEGIVNHEAMSVGVPVIAFGRGCISEFIGADCGKVIDQSAPFVSTAIEQISNWLDDPSSFEAASKGALARFSETYNQNERRWEQLVDDIVGAPASALAS
jgi:glycosyltransferase involved in cell wall biosynthesis